MSSEVSTKTQMKKSTGGKSGKAKKLTKKQLEAQKVENQDTQEQVPVVEVHEHQDTQNVQLGGGEAVDPVAEEQQSGGGKKTKSKKEKKEKGPKKPRAKTAYNFFVSENMKKLMELDEWKGKKNSELMKECGARWKS